MNNMNEIQCLMKDVKNNEQYFKDIDTAKYINNSIINAMSYYKESINKVLSMVNITKILDLEFSMNKNDNNNNYHIVLTNRGIKERYINGHYMSQSTSVPIEDFGKVFTKGIKIIFNHPEISTVQKNKITPLKDINLDFLSKVILRKEEKMSDVRLIDTDMEILTLDVNIPRFSTENGKYTTLTIFSLLSIRTQIENSLQEYLEERITTLTTLKEKQKELENLFPIVFLFGK